MKFFLFLSAVCIVFAFSCKEDTKKETGDPAQEFSYQSLIAQADSVFAGETVSITATAVGYNLEYYWSATQGDILGFGATVIYSTSPCQVGENTVTCVVKDGRGSSETKSVAIQVQ